MPESHVWITVREVITNVPPEVVAQGNAAIATWQAVQESSAPAGESRPRPSPSAPATATED